MLNIFFIGSGRLAHNLAKAFSSATDIHIAGVYSKTKKHAETFSIKFNAPVFYDLQGIPQNCDIYFLAVSDNAIYEVSSAITVSGIVVHCSGMSSLKTLELHKHTGVFWPIQTFSKDSNTDFINIPVCIETANENDFRILEAAGDKISKSILRVNERERQSLHLAAVVVNNFSNYLFNMAAKFLEKNNIDFDILKPLILETVNKLQNMTPENAQTGPASRKDFITIAKHEELLRSNEELLKIYRLLTTGIIDNLE